MHRKAWICSLAALTALVAAAPAAAASAPVVKAVTKKVPVREGRITESRVGCPGRMAAIAGSVVARPTASTLRRSLPSGPSTWRFAFGGFVGARGHTATVLVRCVALRVPAGVGMVKLNVNTVSSGRGVGALSRREDTLRCRKGYAPTDWGFDIAPPGATQNVLPPEEVQVYKALASSSGYAFGLENLGGSSSRALVRVRCLERRAAGRSGRSHTWRLRGQRYHDLIKAGARTVRHSCARGFTSIGPGHEVDPAGDTLFRRSFDVRSASAAWLFDKPDGSERVTTQLLCLSTRTQFR